MPELNSYIIHRRLGEGLKASIAYGNQSIEDKSPSDYPYTGAWIPLLKQYPTGAHYSITAAVNQEEQGTFTRDWHENEDPFTQADLLNGEEKKVQELIFRIRTSLSIPYREILADRLLTLFNDAREDDPASLGIAVGSLRNFYSFLLLHTNLKCPTISLTPDYNIYASWESEPNRLFSVHFLLNGDARFVIFKPNDRHPERQIRISGATTTDILREIVEPYGVWDWVSE
jgi:hypothetical protein